MGVGADPLGCGKMIKTGRELTYGPAISVEEVGGVAVIKCVVSVTPAAGNWRPTK